MSDLLGLLRSAVADAIVPGRTACVLSGGVDSSTITRLALELDPEIPTFTGYYDVPGFDEREYALLAAGANHTEILITPEDFVTYFDGMALCAREPFQGMGMCGQYMVARHVASCGRTVALSGEGGDELFGGYARLIIVAGGLRPDGYDDYRLPDDYPRSLEAALAYDWDRLPDLLAVDDQMCGAWDVKAVAPMTDARVVEWALALPARDRVAKRVLKDAVRGIVPDAILARRDKMGMPIPLVRWAHEHEGVRDLVLERIGYLPDPARPWDRGWFHEMLRASQRFEPADVEVVA